MEGAALQGPPQHQDLLAARPTRLQGRPQLLGDVGTDPTVRGRRRGQDRGARRQSRQQGGDAPVVGAEVVAPVRDAVGLVDDHQCGARSQVGEDLIAEDRVVEALRGDQQDIDLTSGHLSLNLLPLGDIGRVHGHGPDPGALGGGHLVAHEGQQRRDDDARPGTGARTGGWQWGARAPASPALSQQDRRHEVHRRLPPPGALDHQGSAACDDQRLDRPPLVLTQARVAAAHELAQDGLGPLTHGRVEPIGAHGTLSVLGILGSCDRHGTTVAWTIKVALP